MQSYGSRSIIAIPFVFMAALIAMYGVDVLIWDEWLIWSRMLAAMERGGLDLWDLFAQQNEQRNFSARVVELVLYATVRANRFYAYALNLVLAGAIFLVVRSAWRYEREASARLVGSPHGAACALGDRSGIDWVEFSFAAMCASALQWEVFTQGVNNALPLTVLPLAGGALFAARRRVGPGGLVALTVIGLVGSFNFANGLFYWPIMAPLVALSARRGQRALLLCAWLFIGAMVWGGYFMDYAKPPHHPSLAYGLAQPFDLLLYFIAYFGAALCSDPNLLIPAVVLGVAGLAALGWSLWTLVVDVWTTKASAPGKGEDRWTSAAVRRFEAEEAVAMRATRLAVAARRYAPWLALAAFGLLSGAATAVGRSGFSVEHAFASRYVTFSNAFWIGLIPLWLAARRARRVRKGEPGRNPGARRSRMATRAVIGLAVLCFALSTVLSVVVLYNKSPRWQAGRAELFVLRDSEALREVFPDPAYLRRLAPMFFRHRLPPFEDIREPGAYHRLDAAPGAAGAIEGVSRSEGSLKDREVGGWLVEGSASRPGTGEPARYVLLTAAERLIYATRPGPDGRWRIRLPGTFFTPGEAVELGALAVFRDHAAARLPADTDTRITGATELEIAPIIDNFFFSP